MEMSKLKHSDDYRGKIVKDNERFTDKLKDEKSRFVENKAKVGKKKNRKKQRFKEEAKASEEQTKEMQEIRNDLVDGKSKEVPFSSESQCFQETEFETHENSTISDKVEKKEKEHSTLDEEVKNLKKKRKQAQKIRENEEGKPKKETSENSSKVASEVMNPDIVPKGDTKTKVSALGRVTDSGLWVAEKGAILTRDYLRSDRDNAGVESGEKVADGSSKLIHGIRNYSKKRGAKKSYQLSQNDLKIRKKKSKLEFQEAKKDLKIDADYGKLSSYKKFQKKKQMKAAIYKNNKVRVRDRIKNAVVSTLHTSKKLILRKVKSAVLILVGVLILGTFVIQFSGSSMSVLNNGASSVAASTYLSDESVLNGINHSFGTLEQGLQDEISSVESNYPGYDEYIINKNGEIGHDVHQLLSYITARYGEAKSVSEVESLIKSLFEAMYSLKYEEEIEIRTRTVEYTYIDENGNEQTGTTEEEYEYKKLIVTLDKREMDLVVREVFSGYPDNLSHYETLLESKGNMEAFFGSGSGDPSEIVHNPNFENPGIAFSEARVRQLFGEAEKHIGKKYVFGANGPDNFDCSSFVCWVYTHSGVMNMPRTTANRIYTDYCNPVRPSEAKAGDIIFFKNTYDTDSVITHVGIYAGEGMMLHAGDPIRFTSIDTPYWREHFYGFGRIKQ